MRIFSRLSNWYFSKGALPYWGVLFLDCLIALFSGYVGSYLEHGGLEFLATYGRQYCLYAIVCCSVPHVPYIFRNIALFVARRP